jgi:hypothetical protein
MPPYQVHKLITSFLLLLLFSCPRIIVAGTLSFSPEGDPLYFGPVYAYEKEHLEQGKLMFTMTACSGSCSYNISYGDPYPPADVRMGIVAAKIVDGGSMPIWIWISCEVPGDHDLHLIIDSTCGTFYRTIKFTCIDYAIAEGSVIDRFSRKPIIEATVEALSYYLTVSMQGGGSYYALGRPGTQVVRVSAEGYVEQILSIEITNGAPLSKDFEMSPIVSLGDAIKALQVSSGLKLSTMPAYHEDINGDGHVAIAEAILLLQLISGLR